MFSKMLVFFEMSAPRKNKSTFIYICTIIKLFIEKAHSGRRFKGCLQFQLILIVYVSNELWSTAVASST